MGHWKGRYPLTRELATQSMLGVFVRVALIKAARGTADAMAQIGAITQSVTALEQFVRLTLEIDIDEKSGGRQTVLESVEGIRRAIAMSISRIKASLQTFQSRDSLERVARRRGIRALSECIEAHGERLGLLYRTRNVLTHTAHVARYTVAEAHDLVETIILASIAARPQYMAAFLLAEAHVMSAVGRHRDARSAYRRVLDLCRRLVAAGERDAWVQVCMGHALARLGRAAEARACYERAIGSDASYALAYLEMGHLEMRAGRYGAALAMYRMAVKLDPGYAPARLERGHALGVVRDKDLDALAVECYEGALLLDTEEMSAYTGCGLALAMMGRHAEAAKWYRRAIGMDPDDAAGRTGLAGSLAQAGRHVDAIAEYRAAIRIADEDIVGAVGRAGTRAGGRRGGGIARSLGPEAAHTGLGDALLEIGRAAEALQAYRAAVRLDARSARARLGLADTLLRIGRAAEALPAYRAAVKLDARSARARLGLADTLLRIGRAAEALQAYRAAVKLDARSAPAWLGLAKVLDMSGRGEEAAEARRRAAELEARK